jgi:nucleotide-binding universal stress UspA family protein
MTLLHPTDFSECAEAAEGEALRLAHQLGGELILLHVTDELPRHGEGLMNLVELREVHDARRRWAAAVLDARVAKIREHGLAARWLIREGAPAPTTIATALEEHAGMIIMGTHGRSGLGRVFLGSVADRVIRAAPCPVLTVRAPGT